MLYLCLNMQAKLARDLKFNQESFWIRIVDLRENFNDDKFTNNFNDNMALENSMEQAIIQEWQQHVSCYSFKRHQETIWEQQKLA